MMERVLGPLPRHMLERADQHADKYIRRGRLNWPEGATTRESIRAVLKLPRLQNLVMQHVDHSAGDFIDLLKRLLAYEPSARMTAEEALSHGFFTRHGNRLSLWHPWFWRSVSHGFKWYGSYDISGYAMPWSSDQKTNGRASMQSIIQMLSEQVLVEVEACMLWLRKQNCKAPLLNSAVVRTCVQNHREMPDWYTCTRSTRCVCILQCGVEFKPKFLNQLLRIVRHNASCKFINIRRWNETFYFEEIEMKFVCRFRGVVRSS